MKKIIILFSVILLSSQISYSQESSLSQKMSFGFNISQFQKDFGIGLNITSPYFAHNSIAVRIRGNMMWNENIQNAITTWTPYANASIGLIGKGADIGNFLRLYGEGGLLLLFPSSDFSSESIELGGYGLFGFEFFFNQKANYFIELGGAGTGAIADKIINKPIYSNGFIIQVGIRVHL